LFIQRSHIATLHDIVMAAFSLTAALYLRLGDDFSQAYSFLLPSVAIFTGVCAVVFSFMGLYKGVWRYASLQDLVRLTKAVTLATLVFLPVLFMVTRLEDFPRSVLVINFLLLLALLGGPRILYRMAKDKTFSFKLTSGEDKRIPILLVGVSDSAVNFLRETSRRNFDYKVVGIVDNNKSRKGRSIHGVKIYGDVDSIPRIIKRLKRENSAPQRIILADDYMGGQTIEKLLKMADTLGFTLAKLPRMSDFNSNVGKIEIKPIAIEDLLGRPQNPPMLGRRKELIQGKKILLTGAGGTIGSEMVRQIAAYKPSLLVLVEISEYNLYAIDKELENSFADVKRVSLIGDVRDVAFLDSVFNQYQPEIVFHAAALKHVPIVENNLVEAFLTNVIGSKNVADMCIKHNAQRMVMISTDKAVHPTSLMGVTKRVAECYVQGLGASKQNHNTIFSTVRFGNVLGSSGSVIPLFQKQLESGGPITVTHPDMVRYFMTVPEAVELVLQASTLDSGDKNEKSSIFVLDMGQPIRIADLALQMIKLAGLRPDIDVKIEYTGIRRGEKLYEELFYSNEEKKPTLYEGIILAAARNIDFADVTENIARINAACAARESDTVLDLLSKVVPEYDANPVVQAKAA
jgi:FlaA1/EpsC-like NDP-sugar epimerase